MTKIEETLKYIDTEDQGLIKAISKALPKLHDFPGGDIDADIIDLSKLSEKEEDALVKTLQKVIYEHRRKVSIVD